MSDAIALPFSVYGVNTGSYTISHAFSISQNSSYYVTPDEYDLGVVIAAGCANAVMVSTPYYFLPASSGYLLVPVFYSDGGVGSFHIFSFYADRITGYNAGSLTASIMLFRAS